MKLHGYSTASTFLLIFSMLRSDLKNFADCKITSFSSHSSSLMTTTNGMDVGQLANILNPDEHPDYPYWKGREWGRWFLKERKRAAAHHPRDRNVAIPHSRMRHTEPVFVVRPDDLLAAFSGHLLQYGTRNQAMVWTKEAFPTFVLQKAGRRVRAFNCGNMYIAGRLRNSYLGNAVPTYLHDYYVAPIRNELGGHIRYPVSRCSQVPPF